MKILVNQIRVANFRAIKKLDLSLSPFTVLVGANNSGKTTLLRALHLALGEGRKPISIEDFHISNGTPTNEIIIDIRIIPVDDDNVRIKKFDEPWYPGVFTETQVNDENDYEYVGLRTRIAPDPRKSGGFSFERNSLKNWDDFDAWPLNTQVGDKAPQIDAIPLYFIDAQRDILQDLREKNSFLGRLSSQIKFDEKKVREIEKLLENLNSEIVDASPVLKHLSNKLSELNETIGSRRTGVEITPVHKKIRDIGKGLNIHLAEESSEPLPLDYHGMGTRSWASLLTIKAFVSWESLEAHEEDDPFHSILALEEPESHLHPNAQRHLLTQMMQMEGQKVISTHSPFIAGRSSLENIRHFYKTNEGPIIGTLDSSFSEADIKKIEREIMNTRGELLFAKCVVLCEGSTEEQMLPIFAEAYWGKSHFENGVCFAGTGSGLNYAAFISFCLAFHIPWFIFGDSEANIVKKLEMQLKDLGLPEIVHSPNIIHLPAGKKIETYLIDEGYQPEIKAGFFERDQFDCVNDKHRDAKKQAIESKTDSELLQELESQKTKVAPYVAEAIVKSNDPKKRIPSAFMQLFQEIDKSFNMGENTQ